MNKREIGENAKRKKQLREMRKNITIERDKKEREKINW